MNILWFLLSIFCFGYYMICANYAGFGSSFINIWLYAAIFFFALAILLSLSKRGMFVIPALVKNIYMTVFMIGLAVFIVLEGLILSGMLSKPVQNCEYLIVLGAQVRGTTITNSLRYRLEAAYEYAAGNKDAKVIVSGGQGSGESVSEAYAMKHYLIELGMEEERIIMEDRSTDTSENIKYSKEIIGRTDVKLGIVTNDFHVYRSLMLAKGQGFTDVCGIPSQADRILKLNYMVREAVGIIKDAVMGNF